MYRVSPFVRRFAWALLGGVAVATLWVNSAPASYYDAIELRLVDVTRPAWIAGDALVITPITVTSEVLMALFLFFVGKELWEALVLQRGALSGRRAFLPAGAVLGSCLGSVLFWLLHSTLFVADEWVSWSSGWSLPIGSEIVLGYVAGRMVFGSGHPALHLLLLVSIATSIVGILVTGFFQPRTGLHLLWLVLPLAASAGVAAFARRAEATDMTERDRRRGQMLWPYALAGLVSWFGVVAAGLPGALGLLPIIPAIPHAERTFGLFAEAEEYLHDPLNRLAHLLVKPLAVVLFLFGLTHGGIDVAAFSTTTTTVLLSLCLGKPLGFVLGALLVAQVFRLPMPAGVRIRDLVLVAMISVISFTVPVLSLDNGLPGGAMAEAARLGFALSLLAWPVTLVVARFLRATG